MADDMPKSAKVLKFEKHGNPTEVLNLVDMPIKECGPSQVVVKMLAAPVNPSDNMTMLGLYPVQPSDGVGGHEGVGEIVATGSACKRLNKGDRVVPLGAGGTWRTYGVFEEDAWCAVDPSLSLADAATLVVNPGTALLMLEDYLDLKPGDCVIQNGANSEVGKYVINMASKRGVKTINIVRDRPNFKELADSLKQMGATLVCTPENVEEETKKAGLEPILGFQCVGGKVATSMFNLLKEHGTLVTYGAMTGEPITVPAPPFIFKDVRMRGFWMAKYSSHSGSREDLRKLMGRLQDMIKGKEIAADCEEVSFQDWKQAFEIKGKKVMFRMNK